MNTKIIIIAIVSFLLGTIFNATHIIPFNWGLPFFPEWDHLITIGLATGIFIIYSKVNELEKRINRIGKHSC